tara:strand:- start:124 stop:474 length:351 start_codon:yes stop_codon:yes gene_type:complete
MEIPLREEECVICFEPMEDGDIAILDCPKKHRYHAKCIGEWMKTKINKRSICPLCITEYAEVFNVIPCKKNDNMKYLSTPPPSYQQLNSMKPLLTERERERELNEVDNCCYPCIIL